MSRLLFITATRIGDAILSTGALAMALERVPGARVTLACGRPAAGLFRAVPGLEKVLILEKGKAGGHWFDLWRACAFQNWDASVDLRGSLTTFFLSSRRRFVWRKSPAIRHKAEEAAAALGLQETPAPCLFLDEQARNAANIALGGRTDFLALGPGANWAGKCWPGGRFAALAWRLAGPKGPLAGAPIVLMGGKDDAPRTGALSAALSGAGLETRDLAGRLDLLAAGAALQGARLFVGNDSGLMHLAAAAGAPTLGLFGPSDEHRYRPWGQCNRAVRGARSFQELKAIDPRLCGPRNLMEDLGVEAAFAAALEVLAHGRL